MILCFSVKAFADQRRKVKPNRKHIASRNPVKVLQSRDNVKNDIFEGDSDDDDDDDDEDGHEEKTVIMLNFIF